MKFTTIRLCAFDQASLSPLRYRHGGIVVKGGMVIGQGFTDYRQEHNFENRAASESLHARHRRKSKLKPGSKLEPGVTELVSVPGHFVPRAHRQ
jgi:hypothetical protein